MEKEVCFLKSSNIDWKTLEDNTDGFRRVETYRYTGTTDANGFLFWPTSVLKVSEGVIIGARNESFDSFALPYANVASNQWTIALYPWNMTGSNGNRQATIVIAYIKF